MKALRCLQNDSGTTAIELALTLPAFLAFLLGTFEYGALMWTQVSLQHGVEMAARCAVITPGTCSDTNTTQSYASSETYGLNPPDSTFSVSTPACGQQVSANYVFSFFTSYFGSPVTVTASSCFPK
jgi:Flp pilus assembly protein TadG